MEFTVFINLEEQIHERALRHVYEVERQEFALYSRSYTYMGCKELHSL